MQGSSKLLCHLFYFNSSWFLLICYNGKKDPGCAAVQVLDSFRDKASPLALLKTSSKLHSLKCKQWGTRTHCFPVRSLTPCSSFCFGVSWRRITKTRSKLRKKISVNENFATLSLSAFEHGVTEMTDIMHARIPLCQQMLWCPEVTDWIGTFHNRLKDHRISAQGFRAQLLHLEQVFPCHLKILLANWAETLDVLPSWQSQQPRWKWWWPQWRAR